MSNDAVAEAFDEFDERLKLDPRQMGAAIERWHDVADALERVNLASTAFLQGSFARKTMRKPLNDVDVVVLVTAGALDAGDAPGEVMGKFQNAVLDTFPQATFEWSKHALTVSFPDADFAVDLTPAKNSHGHLVLIGNTDTGGWDQSDCRLMKDAVVERNRLTDGRFIHQARMVREIAARMLGLDSRLSVLNGLVAESILFAAVDRPLTHDIAMLKFLEAGASMADGEILTPSGYEDLTRKKEWSGQDRELVRDAFEKRRRAALEAVALSEAGDSERAVENWADICGEQFPLPEGAVEDLLSGMSEGGATRSGGVTRSISTGVHVAPQRAWRS